MDDPSAEQDSGTAVFKFGDSSTPSQTTFSFAFGGPVDDVESPFSSTSPTGLFDQTEALSARSFLPPLAETQVTASPSDKALHQETSDESAKLAEQLGDVYISGKKRPARHATEEVQRQHQEQLRLDAMGRYAEEEDDDDDDSRDNQEAAAQEDDDDDSQDDFDDEHDSDDDRYHLGMGNDYGDGFYSKAPSSFHRQRWLTAMARPRPRTDMHGLCFSFRHDVDVKMPGQTLVFAPSTTHSSPREFVALPDLILYKIADMSSLAQVARLRMTCKALHHRLPLVRLLDLPDLDDDTPSDNSRFFTPLFWLPAGAVLRRLEYHVDCFKDQGWGNRKGWIDSCFFDDQGREVSRTGEPLGLASHRGALIPPHILIPAPLDKIRALRFARRVGGGGGHRLQLVGLCVLVEMHVR